MTPERYGAVVTLWCVTAASPEAVIATLPKADRGFGRKLLAQVNPRWAATPIGQFSLNRSITAGEGEFYIAGFPGVTIIQTALPDCRSLAELDPRLLSVIPAADVYAFAVGTHAPLAGYAHWRGGQLNRSFLRTATRTLEDIGSRQDFEVTDPSFTPAATLRRAQVAWLGFDPATGPDINVVAYAVDGRPEPKVTAPRSRNTGATTPGLTGGARDYDDYEDQAAYEEEQRAEKPAARTALRLLTRAAMAIGSGIRTLFAKARRARHRIAHRLRYSDRPGHTNRSDRSRS